MMEEEWITERLADADLTWMNGRYADVTNNITHCTVRHLLRINTHGEIVLDDCETSYLTLFIDTVSVLGNTVVFRADHSTCGRPPLEITMQLIDADEM